MVAGLLIYLSGQRYLPTQALQPRTEPSANIGERMSRDTLVLLFGLGAAVAVFRSAYEQVGNTVALWADTGVDKMAGQVSIPMTWFIALNPLCVMLITPFLLAWWRKREAAGLETAPTQRMATGALIVGASYLFLAVLSAGNAAAHWQWFALFWVVLTFGELFILPTGLGLFARLAPQRLGATTVASWFLATFAGNLASGVVGTWWTHMSHTAFFVVVALICAISAIGLRLMDARARRVARSTALQADPG